MPCSHLQFLSSEAFTPYEQAGAVVVPIPYEATTTYRKGCAHGPEAILTASDQLEAYDEELRRSPCHEVGIYTLPPIADTRQQPSLSADQMLQQTQATTAPILQAGKFIVALGGEHAITAGIVQAVKAVVTEPFTVVQIDAHGDLRASFEGSPHNHACVMRRVWELGLPTLPLGIRAICQEEADLIQAHNIPVFWAREMMHNPLWPEQAIAAITTEKVFLTIDMDGFDPSLIPGVGTPEPGGLGWYDVLRFLRLLFRHKQVIAADVMELAPLTDSVVSEFTTAKLVYKIIGYAHGA